AVDVFRVVADRDPDALLAQPLDVGAVGNVRARHGVAEVRQHLGDAAHADAADADEMNRTEVARQFHVDVTPSFSYTSGGSCSVAMLCQIAPPPPQPSPARGREPSEFRGADSISTQSGDPQDQLGEPVRR